ncbi:O-antigen/teichoic acid export membrane protein [Bradyrhizobium sp. LM3.4]
MIRLFAIAGYFYQSAAAVILIFAISHLLPAADYTGFSFAMASSQLLCVFMFEWLQLSGLRFLAAAKESEAARLRSSLFAAGLLSAGALIAVGSCASLISGPRPGLVALGLSVAVLQGLTDLYFLSVRLSDRLGTASFLLALRATALLIGALAGAAISQTAEAALLGIVSGHTLGFLAGLVAYRTPLERVTLRTMLADWKDFSRYGMLAAGASVIHLSVPVLLRIIVIGRLGATGAGAGFSIALDLLQRPFWVLNAAIHTVSYPDVVKDFEHGSVARSVQSTRRMFEFMLCTTLVLLGGLVAFIPDAARILVPQESLNGFLATAPTVAAFYFLHTHLQATIAVVPHLEKLATRLVVVAAGPARDGCGVLLGRGVCRPVARRGNRLGLDRHARSDFGRARPYPQVPGVSARVAGHSSRCGGHHDRIARVHADGTRDMARRQDHCRRGCNGRHRLERKLSEVGSPRLICRNGAAAKQLGNCNQYDCICLVARHGREALQSHQAFERRAQAAQRFGSATRGNLESAFLTSCCAGITSLFC